ncbi:MAG: multicopper oxidase domain-containing protein [Planctomycetota bacterium]
MAWMALPASTCLRSGGAIRSVTIHAYQHGTHMYHPHHDEMTQMAMGLMGLFIIHPARAREPRIDRDLAILLSSGESIRAPGGRTPTR